MSGLAAVVAGAGLALLYVTVARRRPHVGERLVLAWGLVVAAALYVVFAIRTASLQWIGLELLGLAVFSAIAAAGAWRWSSLLVVGWVTHVAWDVLLHGAATPFVPSWYPPLCVGFDLVVAGAIIQRLRVWNGSRAARREGT